MSDKLWRDDLDFDVDYNLDSVICETKKHDDAILKSKDISKAQIWTAISILNKKISDLSNERS